MKKIIVTGAAGFIGFHLSKFLANNKFDVLGIDSLNNYYDVNLKIQRKKILEEFPNFSFEHTDLCDYSKLKNIFTKFNPNFVVNLAAQAGVRYSQINPRAYLDSNLVGFFNVLQLSEEMKVQKLIYASSSSVYGSNKKIPFEESDLTDQPISLYAASKKSNELLAANFSHNSNIPSVGLRFFTVYGPYGRPDMAYYSFAEKINENQEITVFNNGKMSRDMTYIDDIINGIFESIHFYQNPGEHEIFNLGNNSPVELWTLIKFLEDKLQKKAKINFLEASTEVQITFANIDKSCKMLNFKPSTSFEQGMNQFIDWYINKK